MRQMLARTIIVLFYLGLAFLWIGSGAVLLGLHKWPEAFLVLGMPTIVMSVIWAFDNCDDRK